MRIIYLFCICLLFFFFTDAKCGTVTHATLMSDDVSRIASFHFITASTFRTCTSSLSLAGARISKSPLRVPQEAGRALKGFWTHCVAKCHHTKPGVINSQLGSEWPHLLNWHHQLIINFN